MPRRLAAALLGLSSVALVATPSASAVSFSNPTPITIFSQQQGAPYPATIKVKELKGRVSKATVTISDPEIAGRIAGGWRLTLQGPTAGRRAAAPAKCKAKPAKKRRSCRAKARKLPV